MRWPTALMLLVLQANCPLHLKDEPCMVLVSGTNVTAHAPLAELEIGDLSFASSGPRGVARGKAPPIVVVVSQRTFEEEMGIVELKQLQGANGCLVDTYAVDSKNWTDCIEEVVPDTADQGRMKLIKDDVDEAGDIAVPAGEATRYLVASDEGWDFHTLNRSLALKTFLVLEMVLPVIALHLLAAKVLRKNDLKNAERRPRKVKRGTKRRSKHKSSSKRRR